MFALWRVIREQVDLKGAKSINAACKQFSLFKVTTPDGFTITDHANDPATLRQRFYTADRARKDPAHYPVLAARCNAYFEDLERQQALQRHMAQMYAHMAQDGHARDGSTLPDAEKTSFALNNTYIKKNK